LLVLLVCLLFLFPVKVGSFQATHGPTTTQEESMFFLLLQFSLSFLGTVLLSLRLLPLSCVPRRFAVLERNSGEGTARTNAPASLRC